MRRIFGALAAVAAVALATPASASLVAFQSFNGTIAVSTDGFGSTGQSGTLTANVPVGSTVIAAYLYTSTYFNQTLAGVGGALNGSNVSYTSIGVNGPSCCALTAGRADVTSIVKPIIDGGPGGAYNFTITETSSSQDGEALVVVYSNAALPNSSVGILDGFASVTGDTTSINFAQPLNPAAPGFFAEMRLGIGFSYDGTGCTDSGQVSQVKVNGTVITNNAGCNDDAVDSPANGNLITMGGDNDPISGLLPATQDDHERYSLASQITAGDTKITVDTINASRDDNIFLAVFHVVGEAGFNEPPPSQSIPEPATLTMLGAGLAGLALARRRRR